jgi:uncharacterized protein YeaO (DUF488 family)
MARAADRIRTRRVYDPPVPGEGERVLVMRLWPRGIAKSKVDRWLKELAPVLPLMRGYRGGKIPWEDYRPRYLAGLERPEARPHVEEILALAREGGVTLLCGCLDVARCHRSLLQQYLAERVGSSERTV